MGNICRYEIFDCDNISDSKSLAYLHRKLLPHSPVALLGEGFMENFYYSDLPRLGLIRGFTVFVNDKPAGFIVATEDPSGFLMEGLKKKWLKLMIVMIKAIAQEPSRLSSVWEAYQIISKLPSSAKKLDSGELLSFGVLPEYSKITMQKSLGQNISKVLVEMTVEQLVKNNCTEIRAVVDKDNLVAKMFYHGLGWAVSDEIVNGWKVPTMQFVWKKDDAENRISES